MRRHLRIFDCQKISGVERDAEVDWNSVQEISMILLQPGGGGGISIRVKLLFRPAVELTAKPSVVQCAAQSIVKFPLHQASQMAGQTLSVVKRFSASDVSMLFYLRKE